MTYMRFSSRVVATTLEQTGFTRLKTSVFSRERMAKRMASRTQAEGQMLLGTVLIKRLQLLIWWIRDHAINRNGDLSSMQPDSPLRLRVRNDNKLRRKVLGTFEPDDFDAYEDAFLKHHEDAFLKLLKDDFDAHEDAFFKLHEAAFLKLLAVRTLSSNLLAQSFDVLKKSLHYILHMAMEPTDFEREVMQRRVRMTIRLF
jgi:hypothetical protein